MEVDDDTTLFHSYIDCHLIYGIELDDSLFFSPQQHYQREVSFFCLWDTLSSVIRFIIRRLSLVYRMPQQIGIHSILCQRDYSFQFMQLLLSQQRMQIGPTYRCRTNLHYSLSSSTLTTTIAMFNNIYKISVPDEHTSPMFYLESVKAQ